MIDTKLIAEVALRCGDSQFEEFEKTIYERALYRANREVAKHYEILDDQGTVINTIISTEGFVESHYPGHWRDVTPEYQEPPTPYNPYQFMKRFTSSERKGIRKSNDEDTQDFMGMLDYGHILTLEDPDIIEGVNHMVDIGLLTAERATEILDPQE